MKVIRTQATYDSKLLSATYDAIKSKEMNNENSSTSDIVDSKIRDIEAAINTFYTSLANNFNMVGYGKKTVDYYVPAVVYTLYDGYYIYTPYNNTLDADDLPDDYNTYATFQAGAIENGLKPYVYYSCRYVGTGYDVVINYSLDSYISIKGTVDNDLFEASGYLLSNVSYDSSTKTATYNGITIEKESELLYENLPVNLFDDESTVIEDVNGEQSYLISVPYKKINGVKYYYYNGNVYSNINGKLYKQSTVQSYSDSAAPYDNGNLEDYFINDYSAVDYYKSAAELKAKISGSSLKNLSSSDAVDSSGNITKRIKIFDELFDTNGDIEGTESNFYLHKMEIIQNSIETNLAVAISTYNEYVDINGVNFEMPKLSATDWEKIASNTCLITFLQGLNLGSKLYNGYCVVPNNKNEEYVSDDSIYIMVDTNKNIKNSQTIDTRTYYKVKDTSLLSDIDSVLFETNSMRGIFNMDLEKKYYTVTIGGELTYYPQNGLGSYSSIISSATDNVGSGSIVEYLNTSDSRYQTQKNFLKKIYYTALARERQSMYRTENAAKLNN